MPHVDFDRSISHGYPTGDGRPMAKTDHHRWLMTHLIETLWDYFADDPNVYVSGNLLLFFEEGNKRRHISPDVFVSFGVPKVWRLNYLTWAEGKGPDVVFELTSSTTQREDQIKKLHLYRDVLKVPEYFLFDPYGDYLDPRFQAFRLVRGEYRPLKIVNGRVESKKLGLILEQDGDDLRLVDPATNLRLPTRAEVAEIERERADTAEERAKIERLRAEVERDRANLAAEQAKFALERAKVADEEIARLRAENERLRQQDNPG